MGRVLLGLALSILSGWMVLALEPGGKQILAWSPFLAPPLAILAVRGARALRSGILLLSFLLLLADALAIGWQGHSGEARLLCYVLHACFAGACLLTVLLGAAWRLLQRYFDARLAGRPK